MGEEIRTGMKCDKCGGDVSMYLEYGTNGDDADYNDIDRPGDVPQVTLFCICGRKVLRGHWDVRYYESEPRDEKPPKPFDWDEFLRDMRNNMRYPGMSYPDPSIR